MLRFLVHWWLFSLQGPPAGKSLHVQPSLSIIRAFQARMCAPGLFRHIGGAGWALWWDGWTHEISRSLWDCWCVLAVSKTNPASPCIWGCIVWARARCWGLKQRHPLSFFIYCMYFQCVLVFSVFHIEFQTSTPTVHEPEPFWLSLPRSLWNLVHPN